MKNYKPGTCFLSLLPLSMRMAGPREALLHCIIRRNYGCDLFIVGRDHAGLGQDFYNDSDAQNICIKYRTELGIDIISINTVSYNPKLDIFSQDNIDTVNISGTELRKMLADGIEIPSWFTFDSVAKILKQAYPPKRDQGYLLCLNGKDEFKNMGVCKGLQFILSSLGRRFSVFKDLKDYNIFMLSELIRHGVICIVLCNESSVFRECPNVISVYIKSENENNFNVDLEVDGSVCDIIYRIAHEISKRGFCMK